MSDIPKARLELHRIAHRLRTHGEDDAALRIAEVIDQYLHRRPPVRQMPIRSRPVTRQVKERIIELAINTELHAAEIAAEVGVNPGRVSEVLHGGH